MNPPKAVLETIATLKAERGPLASRLDAIDLAIDNLSRVYGLHGTPQPLPLERRPTERRAGRTPKIVKGAKVTGSAIERREVVLTAIAKSEVGLTLEGLRKITPTMDSKDRSNAIQILKADGKIKRSGNTWVVAA